MEIGKKNQAPKEISERKKSDNESKLFTKEVKLLILGAAIGAALSVFSTFFIDAIKSFNNERALVKVLYFEILSNVYHIYQELSQISIDDTLSVDSISYCKTYNRKFYGNEKQLDSIISNGYNPIPRYT